MSNLYYYQLQAGCAQPVYIRRPSAVVIQSQQRRAPITLDIPAQNIILKNDEPQPIIVRQSNPNVIIQNSQNDLCETTVEESLPTTTSLPHFPGTVVNGTDMLQTMHQTHHMQMQQTPHMHSQQQIHFQQSLPLHQTQQLQLQQSLPMYQPQMKLQQSHPMQQIQQAQPMYQMQQTEAPYNYQHHNMMYANPTNSMNPPMYANNYYSMNGMPMNTMHVTSNLTGMGMEVEMDMDMDMNDIGYRRPSMNKMIYKTVSSDYNTAVPMNSMSSTNVDPNICGLHLNSLAPYTYH